MKKISKIFVILSLILLAGAGISAPVQETDAAVCFYPFQRIDLEEVYNGSVCQAYFQVYYFPVITDGRMYTITLRSIEGEQKFYASRYKDEVDELSDLHGWQCNDDHCDSSTQVDAKTKIVTFHAPYGEPGYYSWFAIYGVNASKYQIGISNNGILPYVSGGNYEPALSSATPVSSSAEPASSSQNSAGDLPQISWKMGATSSIFNFNDISWAGVSFNDAGWQDMALPDKSPWNCEHCFRQYRGTFSLDSAPTNLKMSFVSDDGIRIYANGQLAGSWGAQNENKFGCVNNSGCTLSYGVGDVPLTNLVSGKNVISVVVINGGQSGYFDFKLKK